jgi:putative PIN family toxin of toxin-antitoxin system
VLRVFVDPNVFVSAVIQPEGTSAAAIRAGLAGHYRFIACPTLVDELADVLGRAKLAPFVSRDEATELVDSTLGSAEMHDDPRPQLAVLHDPADEYLVGLAMAANADLIVSGDRDLLDASVPRAVVSPWQLLERLAPL